MSVKLAKNGTWLAQFRCDKFGNEVHKCKRAGSRRRKRRRLGRMSSSPARLHHGDDVRRVLQGLRSRSSPQAARGAPGGRRSTRSSRGAALREQEDGRIRTIDIVRWQECPHGADANDGKPYSAGCAGSTASDRLRTLNNQLTAPTTRRYGLSPTPAMRTVKMGGKEARMMNFWTKTSI